MLRFRLNRRGGGEIIVIATWSLTVRHQRSFGDVVFYAAAAADAIPGVIVFQRRYVGSRDVDATASTNADIPGADAAGSGVVSVLFVARGQGGPFRRHHLKRRWRR